MRKGEENETVAGAGGFCTRELHKSKELFEYLYVFQAETSRHAAIYIVVIIVVFVMAGSIKYCKLLSNLGAMNPKSSW
jgi:hypothetical protein